MDTTSTPPSQPGPSGSGPAWQPGSGQPPYGQPGTPPYGQPGTPPYAGATPPPGQPRTGASSLDGFFDSVRRWGVVRTDERWIGGVCGGVARRWNIDVALVRGIAVASMLVAGVGLVLYGAAWLLLPEESDGRSHLQELLRGNFDIAVVGGFAALGTGLSWNNPWNWFTPWGDAVTGIAWVVAITLAVVITMTSLGARQNGPRGTGPVPPPGTPNGSPFTGTDAGAAPYAPPYAAAAQPADSATATADTPYGTPAGGFATATDHPAAGTATETPSAERPYSGTAPGTPGATYPGATYPGTAAFGPASPGPYGPAWGTPPPKPRGPVVKGAGPVTVSIVLGVSAIVAAVLLALSRTGAFDGPVLLTSLGVLIGLIGVATMISGIRGRSTGALGGVAVLAILAAGPTAAWHALDLDIASAEGIVIGDESFAPTSQASAEKGFAMGMGTWVVDLTGVPLTPGTTVTVPASFAAGKLTVYVGEDTAWAADVRLNAGSITVIENDDMHNAEGVSTTERRFVSSSVSNGATATLNLSVTGLAGEIRIEER